MADRPLQSLSGYKSPSFVEAGCGCLLIALALFILVGAAVLIVWMVS
jgi:hypothetical protein